MSKEDSSALEFSVVMKPNETCRHCKSSPAEFVIIRKVRPVGMVTLYLCTTCMPKYDWSNLANMLESIQEKDLQRDSEMRKATEISLACGCSIGLTQIVVTDKERSGVIKPCILHKNDPIMQRYLEQQFRQKCADFSRKQA
jgi:hypothetical protein